MTPADAVVATELLAELGYPDNSVDDVRRRLALWSGERYGVVLAAEVEGQTHGLVAVSAIPYLERSGRWARVVALVVSERSRGHGVGRALMAAAEEFALEAGCLVVEVTSANRRTDAHAFYRGLGYDDWADRSGRFLKELEPGAMGASYAARRPGGG